MFTWCNGYHGPTIGIAYTYDFKKFVQCENAFLPYNRNGVAFPAQDQRKIRDGFPSVRYRPHAVRRRLLLREPGHGILGQAPLCHGHHQRRSLRLAVKKIGPGPVPIETDEGWLLFYHGVLNSCNGFVYSFGAALLDIDEPWKVKYRTRPYLLSPQKIYECVGDVPNVVFPCATLTDAETGRIAIYYGCADTVTGLAFTTVDDVLNYMKENSL